MSSRSMAAAQERRVLVSLYVVVVTVSALAIVGGGLSTFMVARSPVGGGLDAHEASGSRPGIGSDVSTSFGVVAVQHVQQLPGLTSRDLAGVTHGISGLVPAEAMQVQVGFTLTNELDHPVAYSPRQVGMLVGDGPEPIRAVDSNTPGGSLQPDASIDMLISFVVPRDGSRLRVVFDDPDRAEPILIDAGVTDVAEQEGDGHGH